MHHLLDGCHEHRLGDVDELVSDAAEKGARVVTGGKRLDGDGWFYAPTIVTDITAEMRMHREEVFGPVASLYRVPDLDAAIELANDTEFGLGSNIWTDDKDEQQRFVRDVQAARIDQELIPYERKARDLLAA